MSKVWFAAVGSTRWTSPFRNLIMPGWPGPFRMAQPLPLLPELHWLALPDAVDSPAFWAPLPPAKAPDASTAPRPADTAIPPRMILRTRVLPSGVLDSQHLPIGNGPLTCWFA